VFQNKVLRTISRPKRDEVKGGWRKLQNKQINNLYSSSNSIRMIKSRRMRWTVHIGYAGENRNG
jgi:hypothetical protein